MAIKTYKTSKNTKLSEHFESNQFASDYSSTVKIDTDLITKLEKFFTYGITKVEINCGYRTPQHSRDVGGYGNDAHTVGIAADIKCYKGSKLIPSSYVACVAQLIGFNGIGMMPKYNSTHVDVRTTKTYSNGHWWGDEHADDYASQNDIKDFFKYNKLTKEEVFEYLGYKKTKKETKKPKTILITYQVWDDVQNKWLPKVTNKEDYAGIFGHDICCFKASINSGNITYRVHTKGGKWNAVMKNGKSIGITNKPIDAITIKTDTSKKIYYRVHLRKKNIWLDKVTGYSTTDSNKYAGILGQEIDAIEIYIK